MPAGSVELPMSMAVAPKVSTFLALGAARAKPELSKMAIRDTYVVARTLLA